jgi:hypothetical protein
MPRNVREGLVVGPVRRDEVDRFNIELDAYHWLGHRIVGETLRSVATEQGRWVALGFGSAALACAPTEIVGWDGKGAAVPPSALCREQPAVVCTARRHKA